MFEIADPIDFVWKIGILIIGVGSFILYVRITLSKLSQRDCEHETRLEETRSMFESYRAELSGKMNEIDKRYQAQITTSSKAFELSIQRLYDKIDSLDNKTSEKIDRLKDLLIELKTNKQI